MDPTRSQPWVSPLARPGTSGLSACLGFRVQGFRFRVKGFGFRARGYGFRN